MRLSNSSSITWPVSSHLRAEQIGLTGLYLFASFAYLHKLPAKIGLGLMILSCILQATEMWRRLRSSALFWMTAFLAAYVLIRALVASTDAPATAGYQWADGRRLLWLTGFLPVACCIKGNQERTVMALGLTLAGFIIGRLLHFDWSFSSPVPWWTRREELGIPSAIAMGQYAAAAWLGLLILGPCLWRLLGKTGKWHWTGVLTWLVLILLTSQFIVMSQSRSVWFNLLLLVSVIALLNWRRALALGPLRTVSLTLAAVILLGGLFYLNRETIVSRLSEEKDLWGYLFTGHLAQIPDTAGNGQPRSIGVRIHMFLFGVKQWRKHPVFGLGPGVTKPLIATHGKPSFKPFNDLHNGFVEILLRLGLLGALPMAACLLWLIRGSWIAYREGQMTGDLLTLLIAGLALHILGNLTNFRMLNYDWRVYWFIFGGALSGFSLFPRERHRKRHEAQKLIPKFPFTGSQNRL